MWKKSQLTIAGFEDGGSGHDQRNVDTLQKLKKATKHILEV